MYADETAEKQQEGFPRTLVSTMMAFRTRSRSFLLSSKKMKDLVSLQCHLKQTERKSSKLICCGVC